MTKHRPGLCEIQVEHLRALSTSDHQQSWCYDGPWKGPGPPLLVAADFYADLDMNSAADMNCGQSNREKNYIYVINDVVSHERRLWPKKRPV